MAKVCDFPSPFTPEVLIEKIIESGKLEQRYNSFWVIFDSFVGQWGHICNLSTPLLLQTVRQYFCANERMKAARGIHNTDPHKRAAYTIWAVNKYRPLVVPLTEMILTTGDQKEKDQILIKMLVNELFALHAGFAHLPIDVADLTENELESIFFLMHTRDVCPDWLSIITFLIQQRSGYKSLYKGQIAERDTQIEKLKIELETMQRKK